MTPVPVPSLARARSYRARPCRRVPPSSAATTALPVSAKTLRPAPTFSALRPASRQTESSPPPHDVSLPTPALASRLRPPATRSARAAPRSRRSAPSRSAPPILARMSSRAHAAQRAALLPPRCSAVPRACRRPKISLSIQRCATRSASTCRCRVRRCRAARRSPAT